MVPTILAKLLEHAPGRPHHHVAILVVLGMAAILMPNNISNPLVWILRFAAFAVACYLILFINQRFNRKEIVDLRDYIVLRAIEGGALLGFVGLGLMFLAEGLLLQQPLSMLEWLFAFTAPFIFGARGLIIVNGVLIQSRSLSSWHHLILIYRSRLEPPRP